MSLSLNSFSLSPIQMEIQAIQPDSTQPRCRSCASRTSLGPGFRFHPTDEEMVRFYLKRKITQRPYGLDAIAVVDVYKNEPWDLPSQAKLKTRDLEWYFFSVLDKKYGSGSRTNRATEKGYWKTTGKDRAIKRGEQVVGMKKTLVYHSGRAPHGDRTNWVMHEYKMTDEELALVGVVPQEAFVLCRIFKKSGAGPKNGERYGAPFIEEEWEDVGEVAPVPDADEASNEVHAIDADAYVERVVRENPRFLFPNYGAADQAFNEAHALHAGSFFEMNDLEKKLDMGVAVGSANFPSNFYYGECSSYPEPSQEFITNQEPLVGTFEIPEPQNGQLFHMAEQYAGDFNSLKDGDNSELSHYENPLNFNYPLDDVDIFQDATDHLIGVDELFLETNDLLDQNMDIDIVDQYLSYPDDDDGQQYMYFDPIGTVEIENPNPVHGPPDIQQNVEGETNDISLTSKHDLEAHSSNEASSKQNPQAPKLVSESTHPLVKRANKWLESLPAPPALALEAPPKEIALRLRAAALSSNVTAGMVNISDMDWMVGKNGGLNSLISTGISQPDVNSTAPQPVSGLHLSFGWIFLMCSSVVFVSLSFKFGCFMCIGN